MESTAPSSPADARAIAAISREMEGVCAMLTSPSPERLERCERILESAVSAFSGMRPDVSALPDVRELRSVVGRAARLLDSAFRYHDDWRRRLSVSLAGYQPGGSPAAMPQQRRMCLEG
jgi:hypothetical protein